MGPSFNGQDISLSRRRRGFNSLRSRKSVYSVLDVEEPKKRGDCLPGGINSARPCRWASCQYHFLRPRTEAEAPEGTLLEPEPLCVLDIADSGEKTLEEVAELMGLSKERIRQLEAKAIRKVKRRLRLIHAAYEMSP